MKILETKRLYLREMTIEDAGHLFLLNQDYDVIRYTGDAAFLNSADAKLFLNKYDHYKKYGFGRWAVIDNTNGNFLGWCGLKYTENLDEFDIGFRFFKKYWNNGYATESAKACLELGFVKFKMPTIVGRAMKENVASIKVLEKIGLKFQGSRNTGSNEEIIYILKNPNR